MSNYKTDVIDTGDALSEAARIAAIEGNKTTQHTKNGLIEDGKINTVEGVKSVITSIDGVGTKVQIYSNAFEQYIKKFEENGSIPEDKDALIELSAKIWKRMFHDLIAMNVDDLRSGEMGVVFTNILDINHVKGIRGDIFAQSFPKALEAAIQDIGINSGNGEIAILGESQKFCEDLKDAIIWAKEEFEQIDERRQERSRTSDAKTRNFFNTDIRKSLVRMSQQRKKLVNRANQIEFNIGGTGEGVEGKTEKLVEMKPGQRIIVFSEKPTEEGIYSPRSNGITRIRELIHSVAGSGWETLKFEEFLGKIGEKKSEKIPDELKQELAGLDMWDIVTGETTVYNPFIANDILGGLDGEPIANVSGLIHITGNPLHKIASGIKDDRLMADIDASKLKSAQVIDLLQYIGEEKDEDGEMVSITDKSAMGSWNVKMPYAIIVDEKDVSTVIAKAKQKGFIGTDVGQIREKNLQDYNKKIVIKSAGINGDTVEKYEEIDRDMPDLPERYTHIHGGKVRETYENPDNPDEMMLIATDRISTHDVVHNSLIPGKGAALTQISNYWYQELAKNEATSDIKTQVVENAQWPEDFPDALKEKTVIVKKLKALPIEAIIRGYLYGSALNGYDPETGKLATGQFVGKGLQKCSQFEQPMFTPSTKSDAGDINIDFDNMHTVLTPWLKQNGYENIDARELSNQIKKISLSIYKVASEKALEKNDIVGDTKLEYGLNAQGKLVLIDEVITPDSSRIWDASTFQEGQEPNSSDKQPVRDEVMKIWKQKPRTDKKKYPITLPSQVIDDTSINYLGMKVKYAA